MEILISTLPPPSVSQQSCLADYNKIYLDMFSLLIAGNVGIRFSFNTEIRILSGVVNVTHTSRFGITKKYSRWRLCRDKTGNAGMKCMASCTCRCAVANSGVENSWRFKGQILSRAGTEERRSLSRILKPQSPPSRELIFVVLESQSWRVKF